MKVEVKEGTVDFSRMERLLESPDFPARMKRIFALQGGVEAVFADPKLPRLWVVTPKAVYPVHYGQLGKPLQRVWPNGVRSEDNV